MPLSLRIALPAILLISLAPPALANKNGLLRFVTKSKIFETISSHPTTKTVRREIDVLKTRWTDFQWRTLTRLTQRQARINVGAAQGFKSPLKAAIGVGLGALGFSLLPQGDCAVPFLFIGGAYCIFDGLQPRGTK